MDEDEDDFQDDDSDLIDDRLECPRCGLTDDLCECES
jgi:ribosomal protein S27AE